MGQKDNLSSLPESSKPAISFYPSAIKNAIAGYFSLNIYPLTIFLLPLCPQTQKHTAK
jgi:hypothetical protein